MRRAWILSLSLLTACGANSGPRDSDASAVVDAAPGDAEGPRDAGALPDSGADDDAGAPSDAGAEVDAGDPDAG